MNLGPRTIASWCTALFFATGVGVPASGACAQEIVTSFAPTLEGPGVWYEVGVLDGGSAQTIDLSGLGGSLEDDQPLPIGAALLTTDLTINTSKAEVGVPEAHGTAGEILTTLELFYAYFKATHADAQNLFAAPSIKLTFWNQDCVLPDDCFGTLIYEPYWNQPGSIGVAAEVPLDQWTEVAIDADTGVFWWTGGFGESSGGGGPPLRTLADWATVFATNGWMAPSFADADLILVSVGVGTFNLGQIGYFDDVEVVHDGYQAAYDFEPAIGPPLDKDECKKGGWMTFNSPSFRNQGDCVSFVVSNGRAQRNP
jgi:hypothetical protein